MASTRPADEPLTGLFIGPLAAQFLFRRVLGRYKATKQFFFYFFFLRFLKSKFKLEGSKMHCLKLFKVNHDFFYLLLKPGLHEPQLPVARSVTLVSSTVL